MRIFLDANILVSVLNKEYPLFTWSSRILSLAGNSLYSFYSSPVCLAIAFYFSEKKSGSQAAKKKLEIIIEKISISTVDKSVVMKAVKNKMVNDFEDGIENYAAKASKCNLIITEDLNDFYFSDLEILTAQQFFEKYLSS